VAAFDLRGHGESDGHRFHVGSFDEFVDDAATVAETLDHSVPWVLYGHSMGGLIATLYLTSERPQPDLAVLSSPGLDDNLPGYLHLAGEVLGRVVPTLAIENSFAAEQLSRDPAVGEAYFADPLVQTKATTGLARAAFAAQREANSRLDQIRVPTLVIHGAEDALVPPHASAPLAAVPGIDRTVYAGLRHETHNEPEQDQVLGDVADWLDAALA
jgi:alpha-beta hydrolase superfamily lysophospholipase